MRGHWCPGGCGTLLGPHLALCAHCALALDKYIDEDPAVVAAIHREAAAGIAALERMLAEKPEAIIP